VSRVQVDLGNGKPRDFYGTVTPHLPWYSVCYAAPEDARHVFLRVNGENKAAELRSHPWWKEYLPTATFL
jgi:hypothetical protein